MRAIRLALGLALAALLALGCRTRPRDTSVPGLASLSTGPRDRLSLGLTVVGSGLALVRETRRVELAPGRQLLLFSGVSDEVIPESVRVGIAGGGAGVVFEEQNYDADLITPGRVTEAAIGSRVRAFVVDPSTGEERRREGTLLGGPRGILLETEEGITPLPAGARLALERMPDGLVPRPTLSWIANARRGGPFDVEVIYLTRGISWRADYVIDLHQEGRTARIQGWATVDNGTALTLADAELQLLAGDVNRVEAALLEVTTSSVDMAVAEAAAPPLPEEEALFEYHLYTVQRPLTLGARQQKQVALVAADRVPFAVTHLARLHLGPRAADIDDRGVRLSLVHDRDGPMGAPLPGGEAVLWIRDGATGQRIQVGTHPVEHTPVGEPLVLESAGNPAFRGRWIPSRYRTDAEGRHLVTGDLSLASRRGEPTPLELSLTAAGDRSVAVEVDGATASRVGPGTWRAELELKPGEEKKVTVRTRP